MAGVVHIYIFDRRSQIVQMFLRPLISVVKLQRDASGVIATI